MNRERRIIVIQPNRKDSKAPNPALSCALLHTAVSAPRKKNSRAALKSKKNSTLTKSIPPRNGSLPGFTPTMVSQVSTPKMRDGFNQMIQDCKKHKIDLILTKSISRFARNTVDSIQYVRMLKQFGVTVIFEKENINTSTMNSEMLLTVLSAFAQAESESISQNISRGKRMGFRHGRFSFPYAQMLAAYQGKCRRSAGDHPPNRLN